MVKLAMMSQDCINQSCECKRNSEYSKKKHNEATNWDQGTLSDAHLSLNVQGIGRLLSLLVCFSHLVEKAEVCSMTVLLLLG